MVAKAAAEGAAVYVAVNNLERADFEGLLPSRSIKTNTSQSGEMNFVCSRGGPTLLHIWKWELCHV